MSDNDLVDELAKVIAGAAEPGKEKPAVSKGMVAGFSVSVEQRVKEINSATGILVPYAARRIFRVKDAVLAEKKIHRKLSEYRLRSDREFFQIPFGKAVSIIEACLESERLGLRQRGELLWFDPRKRYGFISVAHDEEDVFLHASQVSSEAIVRLQPGVEIEFEPGRRIQGKCDLNISFPLQDN